MAEREQISANLREQLDAIRAQFEDRVERAQSQNQSQLLDLQSQAEQIIETYTTESAQCTGCFPQDPARTMLKMIETVDWIGSTY